MPLPYVKLDAVTRAQIVQGPAGTRVVRTGWIKGMDLTGLPQSYVFVSAAGATGMPAYNSPLPAPGWESLLLRQRFIEGMEGNPRKVRLTLVYEQLDGGLGSPIVTFVLTRDTSMTQRMTETTPIGRVPIITTWRDPKNPTRVVRRTSKIPYFVPFQRLQASAYYKSEPPADMLGALRTTNDAQWRGLPKGYWFYGHQSDVTRDRGNSYNISVELWTKIQEDWSEYNFLRDDRGNFLPPDADELAGLVARPYMRGIQSINGCTRVGPYEAANFSSIFGFGSIGAPAPAPSGGW